MELNRRHFLGLGAAAAAASTLTGCGRIMQQVAQVSLEPAEWPDEPSSKTVRLINRVGFGPKPGDLARFEALGKQAYIEQQLQGNLEEPFFLTALLHRLDVLRMEGMELRDMPETEILRQHQQAAILRALYSPNQLRERMVDFWTNHFNIYARKGLASYRKGRDEQSVVRENALGSFPAMVKASAKSPAMLAYLDNDSNFKGRPNENYARELMELHTLGVHGGYTQRDILEVARCFSGWTIERGFMRPVGKLTFVPDQHDDGEKEVLGHKIPAGGGPKDVDQVLDILTSHPATARFVARKLCRYFLGSESESIVRDAADAYMRHDGEIAAILRPILFSEAFQVGPPILKRPFDFLISALRACDAQTSAHAGLQEALRQMGQPTYEWPMPDGYPTEFEAWSGSLLARWNFAFRLADHRLGDTTPRIQDHRGAFVGSVEDFLAINFFGLNANHASLEGLRKSWATLDPDGSTENLRHAAALCLASPMFQWR